MHRELTLLAGRGFITSCQHPRQCARGAELTFSWHFHRSLTLRWIDDGRRLDIPDVLPQVAEWPRLEKQVRAFIRYFCGAEVPEHRRLVCQRLRVVRKNNDLGVQVSFADMPDQRVIEGCLQLLNAVHEVYTVLLRSGEFDDYTAVVLGRKDDSFA